ncbi:hypothetical protein DJ019_01445 [Phenylobacterium kunshanense]|uniref:site-specific DNA-methyltransferase (adenine-specific) n=2 Tax=Phenylobacterium kunshanense TaxID=1445034 RepID=A0A328BUI3_9CAUL|nr:hypothetical protein DJ019_01445 [Phenylobacterium kunshanense]
MNPPENSAARTRDMTPLAAQVLAATGYLDSDGTPTEGLVLPEGADRSAADGTRIAPLMSTEDGGLAADAVFKVGTAPIIVFKSTDRLDGDEVQWHRLAWNAGVAPLLWVTTPQYVRIYNAYQPPADYGGESPVLGTFGLEDDVDAVLRSIRDICGRRHVAMGGFWRSAFARPVDRRNRVDNVLLRELTALLRKLVAKGLSAGLAQKLVGRCIFFQYLAHRGYVAPVELEQRFGRPDLHAILEDLDSTYRLFRWIRTTFNGDLFPIENEAAEREQLGGTAAPLEPLNAFFGHFNVSDAQGQLFPFRFEAIPVELISSIYEKFVHMAETDDAPKRGVHYTPINLVDLVLDPVFEGLSSDARVLDPACGSGVFLVESLRRLVWLRSRSGPLTRQAVRDILMGQIRGIDISPAALSVAAFSLYLALLELDPDPPRGIDALDCLRFEPLENQVLFATSTFDPRLAERLAGSGVDARFDVIVGNPPWTHDPKAKALDRALVKASRDATAADDAPAAEEEDESRRSGVTYARKAGLTLPQRSNDWAFLWRCRDFAGPATRIALVMKATPFFSLERAAATRDRLLRAFPDISLVNLAQLRLSRLFQEYEGDRGDAKAAAGPALLFFSNVLAGNPGAITVINMPWTSVFQSTGIFELPADPPTTMAVDLLAKHPSLLKAAAYGEERDVWLLQRFRRSKRMACFADLVRSMGVIAGQGWQPGTKYPASHLRGLPVLTAKTFQALRIAAPLPPFNADRANRAYALDRYKGPLVMLPEGGLTHALERGRYTAAFDTRTIAYNESFIGVSFKTARAARAFNAVMNSAIVAYQLAFTGCTLGIKQTKVERVDLDEVWLPRLDLLSESQIDRLVTLEGELAEAHGPGLDLMIPSLLQELDALVYDACGLDAAERAILDDAVRRARAVMFETANDRGPMDAAPTAEDVQAYAKNLCAALNAYADAPGDLVLIPDCYAPAANDMIVMRFRLTADARPQPAELSLAADTAAVTPYELSEQMGGPDLPYLRPLQSLRLYVGDILIIAKPARFRCFTAAAAWSDGDRVLADLMQPNETVLVGGAAA